MKVVLFLVIAVGAVIGFAVPSAKTSAPASVEASSAGSAATWSSTVYRETSLDRKWDGHFYVDAEVNGRIVHFLVDTGATTVALTTEDAQRIGIKFDPGRFTAIARGASGDVLGQDVTLDYVDIEGKRVPHITAMVAEGLDVSLLGQAYLARISGVQMNGDSMILR